MIGMLVLVVFSSMMSRVVFSPIMPILQRELGFNLTFAGSLFLVVNVSYGFTLLTAGFLSARVGHGMTIVIALATVALGLVIAALGSVPLLLAGVVLIGAGAGFYPSSGLVMINENVDDSHRSTAFSLHEIGPNLALLVAPLVVAVLQPWIGWRGVLLTVAALALLSALAFWRWASDGSGRGVVPNLETVLSILRLPDVWLAIVVLSAALAGVQGVYAILPAYLVAAYGLEPDSVYLLVFASRVTGIFLLLWAGPVINRIGRRRTITIVLLISALLTALIGLARGTLLSAVVVAQPVLLTVLFPALLASIGTIGEVRYQNVLYSLVITIAVSIGAGAAPTLLGFFADLEYGWVGFVGTGAYMVVGVLLMWARPGFARPRNQIHSR